MALDLSLVKEEYFKDKNLYKLRVTICNKYGEVCNKGIYRVVATSEDEAIEAVEDDCHYGKYVKSYTVEGCWKFNSREAWNDMECVGVDYLTGEVSYYNTVRR